MEKGGTKMQSQVIKSIFISLLILASSVSPSFGDTLRYEGSVTIGRFLDMARMLYDKSDIILNVSTESKGGEECLLYDSCDIGGVGKEVNPQLLKKGLKATLIGKDAIAVIANSENPVSQLSMGQVKKIFTGRIVNWKELGGPNQPIEVLLTPPRSASNEIFREIVLKGEHYRGKTIYPDSAIVLNVSKNKWAVGQIPFFFIGKGSGVKPIRINGEEAASNNPNYPISRPLYLLTKKNPEEKVKKFIDWVLSSEGQNLVKKFFIVSK
jgi:phosphate transport system substrate-binding protein